MIIKIKERHLVITEEGIVIIKLEWLFFCKTEFFECILTSCIYKKSNNNNNKEA